MDGGGTHRTPEDVFRDFRARRAGMIKALTTGTRLRLTPPFPPSPRGIFRMVSWMKWNPEPAQASIGWLAGG